MSVYGERELDARVAMALGSFVWRANGSGDMRFLSPSAEFVSFPVCGDGPEAPPADSTSLRYVPHFSTDPAAYMALLGDKEVAPGGWELKTVEDGRGRFYFCRIWRSAGRARGAAAPREGEAICRAVLSALKGVG